MDDTIKKQRTGFPFVATLLFLLSALFLGGTLQGQCRLAAFGKKADGVVTKLRAATSSSSSSGTRNSSGGYNRSGGGGTTYFYTVRFTPENGPPVEFETTGCWGTVLVVGDAVKIIYLPSRPTRAEIYTTKQLWLPMCTGLGMGLACLGGGGFMLRRRRRAV